MKRVAKIFFAMFLIYAILLLSCVPAFAAENVPSPVLQASESVVRIVAETVGKTTFGSGFVTRSNRSVTLIATNYHVVEGDPYQISVWISEDKAISAEILAFSDQKDLCILELEDPVSLPALKLNMEGIKQGDAVYAVGFPAEGSSSGAQAQTSEDVTITDSTVSIFQQMAVVSNGVPVSLLQINATTDPGNSGGPLFDAHGEVVGISPYLQSDKYLTLINAIRKQYTFAEEEAAEVMKILDFEDAAEIIVSRFDYAEIFLTGTWRTSGGGYYFKMDSDGYISYNLPWFNYGDYYEIEDGKLKLCEDLNNKRDLFAFIVLSADSMRVYCYKDGSSYTLYKQ